MYIPPSTVATLSHGGFPLQSNTVGDPADGLTRRTVKPCDPSSLGDGDTVSLSPGRVPREDSSPVDITIDFHDLSPSARDRLLESTAHDEVSWNGRTRVSRKSERDPLSYNTFWSLGKRDSYPPTTAPYDRPSSPPQTNTGGTGGIHIPDWLKLTAISSASVIGAVGVVLGARHYGPDAWRYVRGSASQSTPVDPDTELGPVNPNTDRDTFPSQAQQFPPLPTSAGWGNSAAIVPLPANYAQERL